MPTIGGAPLSIEGPAILLYQAWRGSWPDRLVWPVWRVPPTAMVRGDRQTVALGVSCILLTDATLTASALVTEAVTVSALVDETLTHSTLLGCEVC